MSLDFISSFKSDFQARLFTIPADKYNDIIAFAKTIGSKDSEVMQIFAQRIINSKPIYTENNRIMLEGITKEILDKEAPLISTLSSSNANAKTMLDFINSSGTQQLKKGANGRYYGIESSHNGVHASIKATVASPNANGSIYGASIAYAGDKSLNLGVKLKPLDVLPVEVAKHTQGLNVGVGLDKNLSLNIASKKFIDTDGFDVSASAGVNVLTGEVGPGLNVELFDHFNYSLTPAGLNPIMLAIQTGIGLYKMFTSSKTSSAANKALSQEGASNIKFKENHHVEKSFFSKISDGISDFFASVKNTFSSSSTENKIYAAKTPNTKQKELQNDFHTQSANSVLMSRA
jgi:hypothetical protein